MRTHGFPARLSSGALLAGPADRGVLALPTGREFLAKPE